MRAGGGGDDLAGARPARPGIAGNQGAVKAAVEKPDFVMEDAQHAERESHYRRTAPRQYLKVVVAYDGAGLGTVITAYPARQIKRGEQQRWPAPTS